MKVRCLYDKLVPIEELKAHPKNANKHSDEQISRLAKIIEYQGWRYPIKVSLLSGYITSGHGRLMAAKRVNCGSVPVNFQDYESEEQEIADVHADNAIASWAELDLSAINIQLADLGPDFDIDMLGIKDFVLEPADKYGDQDADSVPEKQLVSHCSAGDLFLLGEHRLLCGDSTDKQSVERLMNGEKADMVFTDPPYGMGLDADYSKMHSKVGTDSTAKAKVGTQGSRWKDVHGDDEPFNPAFILEYFRDVQEIFMWGGDYYCDKLPLGTFIVWDKNNGNENADAMIGNAYEMAWSKKKHKKVMARMFGRGTFGHDKVKVHPTQKPVQLAEWFFERWGKEAKLIWDGYLGSGSTLIACEKTDRKCYGMEIDPIYCGVILDRWAKFTGKDPVREDGKPWSEIKADALRA